MVGGSELLDDRAFGKGHVIFVGGNNFIGILLRGLFYHLEERRLLFHSVDDERSAEDFVAAVFRIDLCEAKYFGIGQLASEVFFYLLEIIHLFFGESQTFLFVVCFQILDIYDGFGLTVGGKQILVKPFVHALQHGVVVGVFVFYGEVFLDAGDAAQTHVLGDFHSVRTPRSDHLAARTCEISFQVVFTFGGGFSKKPAEFIAVCLAEAAIALYGNHALGRGSEKKNHSYILRLYELRF